MNQQQEILRILKIAGRHGMNKLFAAQYLHVFGLGEIIARLRRKGYEIKSLIVNQDTEQSHIKYVLRVQNVYDRVMDEECINAFSK